MRIRGRFAIKTMLVAALALALSAVFVPGIVSARSRRIQRSENDKFGSVLLAFGNMYGVDGGFVGTSEATRGVLGDELPWKIAGSARGVLTIDGHLRIKVRGLVFTDDPEVPADIRGKNDESEFRGMVSCLSEDLATEAVITSNVISQGFPASVTGNSDIDARLTLPNPCVAPIVFVLAGSEEKWFAVSGFEAETDQGGDDDHNGDDDQGEDDHNDDGGDDDGDND